MFRLFKSSRSPNMYHIELYSSSVQDHYYVPAEDRYDPKLQAVLSLNWFSGKTRPFSSRTNVGRAGNHWFTLEVGLINRIFVLTFNYKPFTFVETGEVKGIFKLPVVKEEYL